MQQGEKKDTYITIKKTSRGDYRDRGSRFIAFASPVQSMEEIKALLEGYRKSYHDARHHCYAWMLGYERDQWRSNDDGEPSGTAGKPILGQINSSELTNILVVVIRYFGGTLLGTGGLINAYRSAAADAIKNAIITECTVRSFYSIRFPYEVMNDVMRIIKDEDIIQSDQIFGQQCSLKAGFRQSCRDRILARFSAISNLVTLYIETK